MKTSATVLVLLALLALVPCTQCVAQTPPAMPPASSVTTTTAPANVADFLATLSGGQSNAPGTEALPPSPKFLSRTVCTSNADCPSGQLCCYPCGIEGCNYVCMDPVKGHCPWFV
ncbi:MAG TPA: hypothetical protein VGG03_22705 [Thermoanaerobaculia bacterium]